MRHKITIAALAIMLGTTAAYSDCDQNDVDRATQFLEDTELKYERGRITRSAINYAKSAVNQAKYCANQISQQDYCLAQEPITMELISLAKDQLRVGVIDSRSYYGILSEHHAFRKICPAQP